MNSIADHLWQSTLFAGAVWLLTLALRNNHARVRHGLWLAASCKFLIPFSVLIALGSQIQWRTAPVAAPSRVNVVIEQVSQPFTAPDVAATTSPASSPFSGILLSVWACGFLGIAGAWWVRWRRIRIAVRAGSPLNLELPIKAMSSPTLLEPGVFGIFRPILLLPEGIFDRLTPAQLQAVIAHELCHVRHRDNLIAAIHMFVETVFWFHPLVWWIGKRMVEERERVCDEEVLREIGEPKAYAEGILNVCKLYIESPLRCVSGITGANLKNRIEVIMSNHVGLRLTSAKKLALAVVGMAALAVPLVVGMLHAQSPAADSPRFEVASIKANNSNEFRVAGGFQPGGRYRVTNYSVRALIAAAYVRPQVNPDFLIAGGPKWIDSDHFDIEAKAAGEFPAAPDGPSAPRRVMLQTLLADRFGLKVHHETRQGPVYALVLAKSDRTMGQHLSASSLLDCTPPTPGAAPKSSCVTKIGPGRVTFAGATLAQFVGLLPRFVDRVVIDSTGLTGRFDLELTWTPAPGEWIAPPLADGPGAPPADGPSLFTALQEQLGLKLQPQTGPIDLLVIDHVERPSEN